MHKNSCNCCDNIHEKKDFIEIIFCLIIYSSAFFVHDVQIKVILFITAYIISGAEIIINSIKNIKNGVTFDENFLMSIATIGAIAIGEYPEAVMVMVLYRIGDYFQDRAVENSKQSIASLMDIRPDYAFVETENGLKKVSPETVKIGEIIVIKSGEKIPLDGVIIEGESSLDTSALTGESAPRFVNVGDKAISGCINLDGILKIEVEKEYINSTVAHILDLAENAGANKAKTEKYITKFARYYTPIVILCAILLTLIPVLIWGKSFNVWFGRALTFLVISCPCAFVISVPLSFFAGIGKASKQGILIKGSNFIEQLSKPNVILFDKTGTLTKGEFRVSQVICEEGIEQEDLLYYGACAEYYSTHPIANAIKYACKKEINPEIIHNVEGKTGRGVKADIDGEHIIIGSKKMLEENDVSAPDYIIPGTTIFLAKNGQYIGQIVITDMIKDESYETIQNLKSKKIKTVMLTGDTEVIGRTVANYLGVDEAHTQLLPEDKVKILEQSKNSAKNGSVMFVGDGVNDAPVLRQADVGIAMGALGSDAAIEAADVVIMNDSLKKISEAINISKNTMKIVNQNIVFAISIKLLFLIGGAYGLVTMWGAVFADVGVTLLAVINSLRVLNIKI